SINRYINTFLYDLIGVTPVRQRRAIIEMDLPNSVAKRFARFQGMCDALLRFLLTTQGDEGFAFEIENVLLADQLRRSKRSTRENIGTLTRDHGVLLRSVPAAQSHGNLLLRSLMNSFDVLVALWRPRYIM